MQHVSKGPETNSLGTTRLDSEAQGQKLQCKQDFFK